MSFRLLNTRVKADKIHGLRKSTLRMDKTNMSSRFLDMRVRTDMTHGLRESTVRIDQ
jgi:hypothetical protein